MIKSIFCLLISCLVFISIDLSAESQKAHIHGVATATLAIEKDKLEIQFESPAEGLIGFEHKARLQEEKQAIKRVEKLLKSPELLFSFKGARCKPEDVSVDLSNLIADKHYEHEHKHEHEHENHSTGHSENGHSEINAIYLFSCNESTSLKSVSLKLFKLFPRIEKIKAMWITDIRQGAELLDRSKNEILLR